MRSWFIREALFLVSGRGLTWYPHLERVQTWGKAAHFLRAAERGTGKLCLSSVEIGTGFHCQQLTEWVCEGAVVVCIQIWQAMGSTARASKRCEATYRLLDHQAFLLCFALLGFTLLPIQRESSQWDHMQTAVCLTKSHIMMKVAEGGRLVLLWWAGSGGEEETFKWRASYPNVHILFVLQKRNFTRFWLMRP